MILSLPVSNFVPVRLSGNPSIQEVLWNFSRVEYKTRRLTLRENPHFYEKLPTSAEGYGDNLKINPIEDFRHTDKFYVLTDKPEMVHIMNNQISRSFGNFWCPSTSIIFKGSCVLSCFFPLFLMYFQTHVGRSREKALSSHLLGAHTVVSVSGFQCPPSRGLPRIVVDCRRLSPRGAH